MPTPHPDLAHLLAKAGRQLRTIKCREFELYGVGPTQRAALLQVQQFPGITQSQLAARLDLDKSTVSLITRKLLQSQQMKKTRRQADRRQWGLEVTLLGRACLKEYCEEPHYLNAILAHDFNEEEIRLLHGFLQRTTAVLNHVLTLPIGAIFPPNFGPRIFK